MRLAFGGFLWTAIPVQEYDPYMSALERVILGVDIESFTIFFSRLVSERLKVDQSQKI